MPAQPTEQQTTVYPIRVKPGIKRDGTEFEGQFYTDGQWVRFQRGLPRKMGGYRQITDTFCGPSRGCFAYPHNGYNDIYSGCSSSLEFISVDQNGYGGGIVDRTPVGFATQSDYVWQFTALYDSSSTGAVIVAHPGRNVSAIDNTTETPVYYGVLPGSTALTTTGQSVSGGAVVLQPFLFLYGNAGQIKWADANTVNFSTGQAGSARVSAFKVVKGLPVRGNPGAAPSGIFWTLDSVIRASYVGGAAIFRFDNVSSESSVLSSSAIIEYDGVYYWPGIDRFLMYNGVVREVPNDMNLNYFFDNLNFQYRQKVWAIKVPRFGEIWWFYPSGESTECNRAVILNVREGSWYDVEIGRSAGYFSQSLRYPVMLGTDPNEDDKYPLWLHEFGVDKIIGSNSYAIQSYFETADISWCDGGPMAQMDGWVGQDFWMRLSRMEPDFIQTGDMTFKVKGRRYARADDQISSPYVFSPTTEKVDLREQRRELRMYFESNVQGGTYQMGQCLVHVDFGDGRQ